MNKNPQLIDIIKLLKAQLTEADLDNSNTGLAIAKAEVSLGFSIREDDTGGQIFLYQDTDNQPHTSKLTLTFSRNKDISQHSDFELANDDLDTDESLGENEFEEFKKRFQASVKQKHGQPPTKKKNIFDCD
jgi:hypothetical protein